MRYTESMTKHIFAVFAHPDDEAFGPSGTLLKEVRSGTNVHLITLTFGGAGSNPENHSDLEAIREDEWRKSGQLIGAKTMHYFGYNDGQLNNIAMIEIAEKITYLVEQVVEKSDTEIEFLSNDTNGITGHIDHIVAARATCLAFYTLKAKDERVKRLRLACIPREALPEENSGWLYREAGRSHEEIEEVVDAREYHDEIVGIINAHYSQRHDGEAHIKNAGDLLGMNYFQVKR